ncbi:MAG: class I SAM-dependent methyltransferase [Phycisphaerae bacterium]
MCHREPDNQELRGKARLFDRWMPEGVETVLDVGCAYSPMLHLLGRKARQAYGVEYDLDKLREAGRRYPAHRYICASGEALPLQAESMDVVTFIEVLEHVDRERRFLEEVHRVLRPGGRIILSVPNKGLAEPLDMDNLVFSPALKAGKRLGLFRHVSDYHLRYHRHYSVQDLQGLFDGLFRIDAVYYGGLVANQIGFLLYKSGTIGLRLLGVGEDAPLMKRMETWMNVVTNWDFERTYGPRSDKLAVRAQRIG